MYKKIISFEVQYFEYIYGNTAQGDSPNTPHKYNKL